MIDYVEVLRRESGRFGACLRRGDPNAQVPSCPDWKLADLGWHLTEVQHFWGSIVGGLLEDPDGVEPLERPSDEGIADLFDDRFARLIDALSGHDPSVRCWTWDDAGWTVGWVRRRQAHEALIHRVDAELAVGDVTPVEGPLAADGADELLRVMVTGYPDWGTFTPDGSAATLAVDGGALYGLRFGRFRGTGPQSGKEFDFEAVVLAEPGGPVVSGPPSAVDLWLWGRGTDDVSGDPAVMERIRAIVTTATQ